MTVGQSGGELEDIVRAVRGTMPCLEELVEAAIKGAGTIYKLLDAVLSCEGQRIAVPIWPLGATST